MFEPLSVTNPAPAATVMFDPVTDSLTLVSSTSNLRLESFLFTEESFASARDHLTPNGIFVMYNYYRQPWLVQRYANMVEQAFGAAPITRTYPTGDFGAAVIANGPLVRALGGGPPRSRAISGVRLVGVGGSAE